MKSPAYQWYPKDIFQSERVAFLSLAEEGAYRRALDFCWLQGSIPSDPVKLSHLIGKKCTTKIAQAIIPLFIMHPTDAARLIHDKLEKIREDQKRFKERQVLNGSKGGRPKKPDESQEKPVGLPDETQPKALHSATATAEIKKPVVVKDIWYEMFRRAAGPQISDDELFLEIGKFKNKYPNKHPNQSGALVNTWVSRIGVEREQIAFELTSSSEKKMVL